MPPTLTIETLHSALDGSAAALRSVTEYQPAGGAGDKVFPPSYEGGKYAVEKRRLPGRPEPIDCVLLDSVQSQANRMEIALLEAWEAKRIALPVVTVDFAKAKNHGFAKVLRITSLEAPHRIADALLRDSLLGDVVFRKSDTGRRLDDVDNRNATALFELCPTALLFGMWDSTGPRGGLGAKFARAIVSEMIGIGATPGVKTSSRIDPAQILLSAGPLYRSNSAAGIGWTLDEANAAKEKGKPAKLGKDGKGKPSEANHGNVTPSIKDGGGITIERALQTTVLSLPALRRLRFPIAGKASAAADRAARTVLAALGVCAATLVREQGCDLRSRCLLVPTEPLEWELIDSPGGEPKRFPVSGASGITLYRDAVAAAKEAGLPWMEDELVLRPSEDLAELVKRSQELAAATGQAEGE